MIVLWVGMPLLSIIMHFFQPEMEDFPFSILVSIVLSTIGGTLASAMLSTSFTSEINQKVYNLFLIRPIKRYSILISKFVAVYICLVIAIIISLSLGLLIDYFTIGELSILFISRLSESLAISLASIAISCSIGILFGVTISSVPVAAILSVYIGNQLSALSIIPTLFLAPLNPIIFALVIGVSIPPALIVISEIIFIRKEF
jgi:ABC-type transport system involved in multi-copper enzyme maturation permease subunit